MRINCVFLVLLVTAIGDCIATSSGQSRTFRHRTLRGGAWTYHVNETTAPCNEFSVVNTINKCEFHTLASYVQQSSAFSHIHRRIVPVNEPNIEFSFDKQALHHLDQVQLTFQVHNFQPTKHDWLGIYCVSDTPVRDSEFLDWHLTNGATSATIVLGPLVNMRCDWQVRYFFRPTRTTNIRMATSASLSFINGPTEPLQVHLAMTNDPNALRVMWTSAAVLNPQVLYGETTVALTRQARATATTYDASDLCHAPATIRHAMLFRDPGILYNAVLENLVPGRQYFYRVGSLEGGFSPIFQFRVPPAPGTSPEPGIPTSFFMFADLGEWSIRPTGPLAAHRAGTTMQLIEQELRRSDRDYVAVLHDGDLSYAEGKAYQWEQFGALIQPVAAQIPYMVAVGNHEYCYVTGGGHGKDLSGAGPRGWHPMGGNYANDSGGECGVPTAKRFHMPENGNQAFWYSFEIGLMHHIMISSEHDATPGSPMYQWLANDLQNVNRTHTPWVFVHLHRPLYVSSIFAPDNRVSEMLRRNLEELLHQYRVDIVFSGHYHSYERTCAVYKQECRYDAPSNQVGATVHVRIGSAGAELDVDATFSNAKWSSARRLEYGFGLVHVYNATHVLLEFERNADGEISDQAWVVSDHSWSL